MRALLWGGMLRRVRNYAPCLGPVAFKDIFHSFNSINPFFTANLAFRMYGDAAWGMEVARGKYESGRFSDGLTR